MCHFNCNTRATEGVNERGSNKPCQQSAEATMQKAKTKKKLNKKTKEKKDRKQIKKRTLTII